MDKKSASPSILKNMGYSSIAQALGRLMRFFMASAALKFYGEAAWGQVAFGLTVVSFASFFLDMGISTLASVEKPADSTWDRIFFVCLGWIRLAVAMLGVVLAWFILPYIGFEGVRVLCIYLIFLIVRPFSLDWLFQRKGYSGLIPIIQAVRQGVILAMVLAKWLPTIESLVVVDLVTEGLAALATWWVGPRRHFSLHLPQREEWPAIRNMYHLASPLFLGSTLILIHQNMDIIVIRFILGLKDVGIYDYSARFVQFAFIVGAGLSVPLRRQLANLGEDGVKVAQGLLRASHKVLGIVSAAFLLFAVYGAPIIFRILVRAESIADALQITRVLSIFLVFSFLSIPLSEWLITRQSKIQYLKLAGLAAVVNLSLNLSLVPWLGVWGAAVAKVGSELAILSFLLTLSNVNIRRETLRLGLGQMVHAPAIIWVLSGHEISWEFGVIHVLAFIGVTYRLGYYQRADLRLLRSY